MPPAGLHMKQSLYPSHQDGTRVVHKDHRILPSRPLGNAQGFFFFFSVDFVALRMMEHGDFHLYLVFMGSSRSSGLKSSSLVPERCGSWVRVHVRVRARACVCALCT